MAQMLMGNVAYFEKSATVHVSLGNSQYPLLDKVTSCRNPFLIKAILWFGQAYAHFFIRPLLI